jgi:hypothetical protein
VKVIACLADDGPNNALETITVFELLAGLFRIADCQRLLSFVDLDKEVLNLCLHPINLTHFCVQIKLLRFE